MKTGPMSNGAAQAIARGSAAFLDATAVEASEYEYELLRDNCAARFHSICHEGPLFQTVYKLGLFADPLDLFLSHLPVNIRQHYNCHNCRSFFKHYGCLVVITAGGEQLPAFWPHEWDGVFGPAVKAMREMITDSSVFGPFVSGHDMLGFDRMGRNENEEMWSHFYARIPASLVFRSQVLSPNQRMAEMRENHRIATEAALEFDINHINAAVSLLESEQLFRSDKVLGPAIFLQRMALLTREKVRRSARAQMHREAALAPDGFCHPKASMIGTLLDDLRAGRSFESCKTSFAAKMAPDQYQRPQAAPTVGNIERAEKLIAQMGLEKSLERRLARIDELQSFWKPTAPTKPSGGVFADLKPKHAATVNVMELPRVPMTWAKFRDTVLPKTERIEILIPKLAPFAGYTTAVHADAPPIIRWDMPARRNPVSAFQFTKPVSPLLVSLNPGTWCEIDALVYFPAHWDERMFPMFSEFTDSVSFVLHDAKLIRRGSGSALFPEVLKTELREIRSTIEAYSNSHDCQGIGEPSACALVIDKAGAGVIVRATQTGGVVGTYLIDRWD